MTREEVLTKLLSGSDVSTEERRLLGAFVTHGEIAWVIALLLERHGRFPLDAEKSGVGTRLLLEANGVRVITRRISVAHPGSVVPRGQAVDRYIDEELGPSCGGVPIRRR
jgi:hypothetical protein